jgi:hypothetical protein
MGSQLQLKFATLNYAQITNGQLTAGLRNAQHNATLEVLFKPVEFDVWIEM